MRACVVVVVVVVVVFVSCVVGQRVEEREGKNERNENKGGSENCFVCFCLDKEKEKGKYSHSCRPDRQCFPTTAPTDPSTSLRTRGAPPRTSPSSPETPSPCR